MKFIQRLGYYLGGFAIGLVLLFFFLGGKKASCDYGPSARTVKHISSKKKIYSQNAIAAMKSKNLDTTIVSDIIRYGSVNFSESDTKSEPCKTYVIENTYMKKEVKISVKNCDSIAKIERISF